MKPRSRNALSPPLVIPRPAPVTTQKQRDRNTIRGTVYVRETPPKKK